MLKKRPKEVFPERREPGDPEPESCAPGSIEQQLDMCEDGTLRGDEILHSHGMTDANEDDLAERDLDLETNRFRTDMSERDREGAEMSGDEHSSGYQGEEPELEGQAHIDTGSPGHERERQERVQSSDTLRRAEEENLILFPRRARKSG